jgi:hypothetical protein
MCCLSTKTATHGSPADNNATERHVEDTKLCTRILTMDPAIRVAALVDGVEISGFATSSKTSNVLTENSGLRDRIGFLGRVVTEIGRQSEPMFGSLESISFSLDRVRLVTIPLSATRSIGLSIEKSTNPDHLVSKIKSRLGLNTTTSR